LETIRDEAKKSLEEKTPEDTLELIKSYKELPTEIKG
jgi:hypothetical protein